MAFAEYRRLLLYIRNIFRSVYKRPSTAWHLTEFFVCILHYHSFNSYFRYYVDMSASSLFLFQDMTGCLQFFDTVGWVAGRASAL